MEKELKDLLKRAYKKWRKISNYLENLDCEVCEYLTLRGVDCNKCVVREECAEITLGKILIARGIKDFAERKLLGAENEG
ncbi:MAG: hypothetical protein ACTSPV_00710 [Candidatus Hodarchaeales archaeon]